MKPAAVVTMFMFLGFFALSPQAYAELNTNQASNPDTVNDEEMQDGRNESSDETRDSYEGGDYLFRPLYSFSAGPLVYFTPGLNGASSNNTHQIATQGDGFGIRILNREGVSVTFFTSTGSADVTSTTSVNPQGYRLLSASAAEQVISAEYNWHQHNFGEASQWIGYLGIGYHSLSGEVNYRGVWGNEDSQIKFSSAGTNLILGGEYVFSTLINLGWYMRIGWSEHMKAGSDNSSFYLSEGHSSGGGIYVGYQF